MTRKLFLLCISVALLFISGFGFVHAGTINELTSTGSTHVYVPLDGKTIVATGRGLVVVENHYSKAPLIRTLDMEGKELSDVVFPMPEVGLINIYDHCIARGPDGSLAIAGAAFSNDSQGARFLAIISPEGNKQTIVRLSPFYPNAVTVAADGTIWVAGHDVASGEKPDLSQHLIRRYDRFGKLLASYIPWSTLTSGDNPHPMPPDDSSILLESKDRVGWYSTHAHRYIEFSLDGSTVNTYAEPDNQEHKVFGAALCDDGSLFVSTPVRDEKQKTRSWGIFTLDRESKEWKFISRDEKWGRLVGSDGTRLAATTEYQVIAWLEPKK